MWQMRSFVSLPFGVLHQPSTERLKMAFPNTTRNVLKERIEGLCNSFGIDASELGPAGIRFANAKMMRTLRRAASGIPQ
jgi:hypothetical protein